MRPNWPGFHLLGCTGSLLPTACIGRVVLSQITTCTWCQNPRLVLSLISFPICFTTRPSGICARLRPKEELGVGGKQSCILGSVFSAAVLAYTNLKCLEIVKCSGKALCNLHVWSHLCAVYIPFSACLKAAGWLHVLARVVEFLGREHCLSAPRLPAGFSLFL